MDLLLPIHVAESLWIPDRGGILTAKARFVVFDLDLEELWQYLDLVSQGVNTFATLAAQTGEAQQYRIEKQLYWAFPMGLLAEGDPAPALGLTKLGRVFVERWKRTSDARKSLLEMLYVNACYDDTLLRLLANFLFFPLVAKGRGSVSVQEALEWTFKQRNFLPSQDEPTIRRQFAIRVSSLTSEAQTSQRSNFSPLTVITRSDGELSLLGHMPSYVAAAYSLSFWVERVAKGRMDARIPIEKLYAEVGGPARLFLLRRPQFQALLEKLYSKKWITLDRIGGLNQVGLAKRADFDTMIREIP